MLTDPYSRIQDALQHPPESTPNDLSQMRH